MTWMLAAVAAMLAADSLLFLFAPRLVKRVVGDLTPWELRLVGAVELALVVTVVASYVAGRLSGSW